MLRPILRSRASTCVTSASSSSPTLKSCCGLSTRSVRELRDVDQALDALLDLDEDAEVGDAGDLALHAAADRIALRHARPRILGELLDAERDALVLDVDAEHDRLDVVALLVELGGVLDLLGPVQVGDVHQAVDALVDADEDAEVGDALHLAL